MNLKKKILLMWSGGISSTCALIQLLTDTQYRNHEIVVHHCHLRDGTNRAKAEAQACAKIINYVADKKKYRKFIFSESNHEYSFLRPPAYNRSIYDLDIVSFIGANICAGSPQIEYFLMGGSKTDIDTNPEYSKILERSQKILKEALSLEEHALELNVDYPTLNFDLRNVYGTIPKPMRKLTMSCRLPEYVDETTHKPCGKCAKCILNKKLLSVAGSKETAGLSN